MGDHRLPQPWAVFTAKERASAPRPSHTRDLCLPGSRAHQRPWLRTSANSPERVRLLLKLVSFSETAMALPKSKSLLVTNPENPQVKWSCPRSSRRPLHVDQEGRRRPQAPRAQPKGQGLQVPPHPHRIQNPPSQQILQDCRCSATQLEVRERHCKHHGRINHLSYYPGSDTSPLKQCHMANRSWRLGRRVRRVRRVLRSIK